MTTMPINLPAIVAEVEAEFAAYERALIENNVAALDAFFWSSEKAIRYGGAENLYGHAEIAAYRAARSPAGLVRRLERTIITTFGRDFATASTLFHRDNAADRVGRQMQSWVRMDSGWKIVAAHVSTIDEPR